ncbi:MAG: peptidase S41, partial [Bacteroidales bacterium]|nr:peptidase S41 [Bacteroidales bacterium]
QAIDYSHKDEDGNPVEVNDTLLEAFETKNGRIVYDGRGIKPDILMSPHEFSDLSKSLIKKFIIFDFSTQYKLENDSLISPDKFEVDDELWSSFLDFIKDKDITYESDLEQKLNIFKAQAQEEDIFEDFQAICEQIQQKIDDKKKNELDLYQEEIKRIIKTDLVSRYYFSKGVIIANLHQDKAIGKAMELLKNSDEYNSLLEGKN